MPYPDCPFAATFRSQLITCLNEEKCDTTISNEEYKRTLKWLCSSPNITTFRVNTLKTSFEEVVRAIRKHVSQVSDERSITIDIHPSLCNVVILKYSNVNEKLLERHYKEIVVDVVCGTAILRGAHIYAPGVMGMMSGTQINDKVSIYADASKKCKKGLQKLYEDDNKIYIGNGIVKMVRHELFGENLTPSGIAVEITGTVSGCPPLGDHFLPPGYALLQNLPSILCVHALDPQPNETIIDMCASPGNKTTHIAELIQNKGALVAIDKTSKKVAHLKKRCDEFDAKVHVFEADSSKILSLDPVDCTLEKEICHGPPFLPETFNRVLLDAPCSVLGKRPQLVNRLSEKMIKSYVPLQRKLFETKHAEVGAGLFKAARRASDEIGLIFDNRQGGQRDADPELVTELQPNQLKARMKAAEQKNLFTQHIDRPLHGVYYKNVEKTLGLSTKLIFAFLRSAGLKLETEGFIVGCQDGVFIVLPDC